MSDSLQHYDAYADKYEAAFTAFERTYCVRMPPPVRQLATSNNHWLRIGLGAMLIASLIVSAFHTLPVFIPEAATAGPVTYIVAAAVFVMIELGIVILSYFVVRYYYNTDDAPKDTRSMVKAARWLVFGLAVSVNVFSVMKGNDFAAGWLWDLADVFIVVFVGISAPTMAYIVGDVLAVTIVDDKRQQVLLDADYAAALEDWRGGLERAWNTSRTRKTVKVENVGNSIPAISNGMENNTPISTGNSIGSTLGHSKRANASDIVKQHLEANPEDASANPFELAQRLGVGKSTVYNVLKEYKEAN